MNKLDFKLKNVDHTDDGHTDYWFTVTGNSQSELFEKYREQGIQGIFEVVYSSDENIVGVKRTFMFNYDVQICDDDSLKSILKQLSVQIKTIKWTIEIPMDFPADWDNEMIEFHLNESCWCCDNLIDELEKYSQNNGCICNICNAEVKKECDT